MIYIPTMVTSVYLLLGYRCQSNLSLGSNNFHCSTPVSRWMQVYFSFGPYDKSVCPLNWLACFSFRPYDKPVCLLNWQPLDLMWPRRNLLFYIVSHFTIHISQYFSIVVLYNSCKFFRLIIYTWVWTTTSIMESHCLNCQHLLKVHGSTYT